MTKTNLTPTKSVCGKKIHIWADVFPEVIDDCMFVATPASFRKITSEHLFMTDQPGDPKIGAMITVSLEEAKNFAEQVLEIIGEE